MMVIIFMTMVRRIMIMMGVDENDEGDDNKWWKMISLVCLICSFSLF